MTRCRGPGTPSPSVPVVDRRGSLAVALPSTAIARRRRLPGTHAVVTRPDSQAPIAVSNPSPVNAERARRMVDAFGVPIPIPRSVSSTASLTASAALSAIAANERAPETTAHTDTNRIAENRCRTPRFLRGSGTDSNTSSKPPRACGATSPSEASWRDRTVIGDDDTVGTARLRSHDGVGTFMVNGPAVSAPNPLDLRRVAPETSRSSRRHSTLPQP